MLLVLTRKIPQMIKMILCLFVCYFWNGFLSFLLGGHFLQSQFHFHFKIPSRGFISIYFPSAAIWLSQHFFAYFWAAQESVLSSDVICICYIQQIQEHREYQSWRGPYPQCWPTPHCMRVELTVKVLSDVLGIVSAVGDSPPTAGSWHTFPSPSSLSTLLHYFHFIF